MSTSFKTRKKQQQQPQRGSTGKEIDLNLTRGGQRFSLPSPSEEYTLSEIREKIRRLPRHKPVLLLGPPGVGKTAVLEQLAEEEANRARRILLDLTEMSPRMILRDILPELIEKPEKYYLYLYIPASRITEEFGSVPDFSSSSELPGIEWKFPAKIVPFLTDIYLSRLRKESLDKYLNILRLIRRYRESPVEKPEIVQVLSTYIPLGILFIDEATQGTPYFREHFMQHLTGQRSWGEAKLSPLVRLVFAANPPEYNIAAQELPEPVLRRVRVFKVKPSLTEWWKYVMSLEPVRETIQRLGQVPEELIHLYAFLQANPQYFVATSDMVRRAQESWTGYPNPATWLEAVGAILQAIESPSQYSEILKDIYDVVGPEAYYAFKTYLELPTPAPRELLAEPRVGAHKFIKTRSELATQKKEGLVGSHFIAEYATNKMLGSLLGYALSNMSSLEQLAPSYAEFFTELIRVNPEFGLDMLGRFARLIEDLTGTTFEQMAMFLQKVLAAMYEKLKKEGIAQTLKINSPEALLARALEKAP